ncbi:uncharacterized protein LOC128929485 isoform X2 [Callithrix jacchus]
MNQGTVSRELTLQFWAGLKCRVSPPNVCKALHTRKTTCMSRDLNPTAISWCRSSCSPPVASGQNQGMGLKMCVVENALSLKSEVLESGPDLRLTGFISPGSRFEHQF